MSDYVSRYTDGQRIHALARLLVVSVLAPTPPAAELPPKVSGDLEDAEMLETMAGGAAYLPHADRLRALAASVRGYASAAERRRALVGVPPAAGAVGRVAIDMGFHPDVSFGDGIQARRRDALEATITLARRVWVGSFFSSSDPTPMEDEPSRDEFSPRWHQLPEDALRAVLDDVIRRSSEFETAAARHSETLATAFSADETEDPAEDFGAIGEKGA